MSASPESLYLWKTIAFPEIQHNTPTICQNTTTDWCKHTLKWYTSFEIPGVHKAYKWRYASSLTSINQTQSLVLYNSVSHNLNIFLLIVDLSFGTKWNTQNPWVLLLCCLQFTFLQLQGGQSYMYKVTLLISFVAHKIYTTSPSWRPVSLLLPVAVREHR